MNGGKDFDTLYVAVISTPRDPTRLRNQNGKSQLGFPSAPVGQVVIPDRYLYDDDRSAVKMDNSLTITIVAILDIATGFNFERVEFFLIRRSTIARMDHFFEILRPTYISEVVARLNHTGWPTFAGAKFLPLPLSFRRTQKLHPGAILFVALVDHEGGSIFVRKLYADAVEQQIARKNTRNYSFASYARQRRR